MIHSLNVIVFDVRINEVWVQMQPGARCVGISMTRAQADAFRPFIDKTIVMQFAPVAEVAAIGPREAAKEVA